MFAALKSALRRLVYSVPSLGRFYRRVRDREWTRLAVKTDEGFMLFAPALMLRRDREERAVFAAQAKLADVCIDVGAHVGYFSCIASGLGTPTVAIEPLADNLAVLYRNLALNKSSNVEVFPLGLGAKPGIAPIYGYSDVASLIPTWSVSANTKSETIPVSTLDILLGGRFPGRKLVIKIDVEGSEFEVLAGSAQTLIRDPKPVWIVEIIYRNPISSAVNKNFLETFNIFWRLGYESFHVETNLRRIGPADIEAWIGGAEPERGVNFLFRSR